LSVATYLYAIVKAARRPSDAGAPPGLPGGSAPRVLRATPSLWLVTADVPLAVYGPGPLESALADLEWVGRIALAHEQVVEHFGHRRGTTLIPMKLFTMFSSPDRAVAEIAPRWRTIDRVMRHVSGAEEWGVRVVRAESGEPAAATPVRPASGTAFLAARKLARDSRRSVQQQTAEAVAEAYVALAKIAKDAVRRDDPAPAGATPPLLDAAFLVPARERRKFDATARRHAVSCAKASAQLTLTGPWPPYHFVRLDTR
jgi:hypothetical protein